MNKQEIREFLDKLEDGGVIDYYVLQSRMPGLRWTIHHHHGTTRVYSTREVRAWVDGLVTGTIAERKAHLDGFD